MKITNAIVSLPVILSALVTFCGCGGITKDSDPTVSSIDITSAEDYERLHSDNPEAIEPIAKVSPKQEKEQPAPTAASIDENSGSDSPAYDLGRRCAMRLIRQCETESEVRDELLDIRAREYGLRTQVGNEAADAYLSGFKSALKESGDTLYKTLFE